MEDIGRFAINYASSLGATYAEARIHKDTNNMTVIKNGVPQFSGFIRELGIGIRLVINGALGFASTNDLDRDSIAETILSATSMARAAATTLKKPISLSSSQARTDSWSVKQKKRFQSVNVEDKLELLFELDKSFRTRRGVKFPARLLSLSETITDKIFLNSEGTYIASQVPRVALSYMITAYSPTKGTAQRFNKRGETGGWEAILTWNLTESISEEAKILSSILEKGRKPPREELDVVLGSEVVGIVCHESCGHPFEADRILGREAAAAGESFVTIDMLGKRLGSTHVNVIDDPTLPNSYGYYLYDDEGVQAAPRQLIKKGIVNTFLHNRETAADLGIESNGASRSTSYAREPIVRMSNTYMDRGDHSFQELIEPISKGIYINSFMEWNIDDRRFNQRYVGLEAYSIRKGELTHIIRNPVIEITTPGLFTSVDAATKDIFFSAATCGKGDPQQGAPVWTGGPSIRLRKVRLGGS